MAEQEGSKARRDELLKWQAAAQQKWEDAKVFEVDAPSEGEGGPDEKFFGTFPYPYMNGLLHLGHAFSLSKLIFSCAYHKLEGKHVLFAQGFHCTGMPIKACADKIDMEITQFGCPPQFPVEVKQTAEPPKEEPKAANVPGAKFSGKKTKAAAKEGPAKRQWDIMVANGVAIDEIPKFRKSEHWLDYFPKLAMRDISALGAGVDWRRSFITTARNPYYDSFIRWQFEVLRRQGRIEKATRLAVYSPKDGQPCADHDRASGEGAKPQDYVLIKMRALELPGPLAALQGKGPVYLLAATLRPETMYGQVNCWVLPDGQYAAFAARSRPYVENGYEPGAPQAAEEDCVFVMTDRSARNLAWQDGLPGDNHVPVKLAEFKGSELLGLPVAAPRSSYKKIYVLPLPSISMTKGTGVVTGAPSDSPDDWRALEDLRSEAKAKYYGLDLETMIAPFKAVPMIDIPGYGTLAAEVVCTRMGIKNQHDTKKLAEAKAEVYLKGFTSGVMTVGNHTGVKVSEAKKLIWNEAIKEGSAVAYSESDKPVVSRSGEDCVVALTDQWYLKYGEPEWQATTRQVLQSMTMYQSGKAFEEALDWLNQWACSRSFGLGTRLPWDPQYLIESLSDSTIYMAFYTVAHILQRGNIYGEAPPAPGAIPPEAVNAEFWEHIFLDGPAPKDGQIPSDVLATCRREFDFWYPMDLRVSGKDLIQNHLTFCLYTHASIWADFPGRQPRAMRTNGHLLLNHQPMSKSKGNFKTLQEGIAEYSADACRVGLADAGDSMDDANFDEKVANAAVLRLTKEAQWMGEAVAAQDSLRTGADTFIDRAFDNEMSAACNITAAAYKGLEFKEALKAGWFELQNLRDWYRVACGQHGMKRDHVLRFIDVQARLMAPIAPHWAEHIWGNILKRNGLVVTAGWPETSPVDASLQHARRYLEKQIVEVRKRVTKAEAPPKKKRGGAAGAPPPAKVQITAVAFQVAPEFTGWHAAVLQQLAGSYETLVGPAAAAQEALKAVPAALAGHPSLAGMPEAKLRAQVMPFAKYKQEEAIEIGSKQMLDVRLPFDEAALLRENEEYLLRSVGLKSLSVATCDAAASAGGTDVALPGAPHMHLS